MSNPTKKLEKELQGHIAGHVTAESSVLDHFALDASLYSVRPSLVVYSHSTADVVELVERVNRRAQAGEVVPITARGKGTDRTGAAVGSGVVAVFTAHMNKLLKMGKDTVTVQPGMLFGTLQSVLHSHGRFLPPYPASLDFSTVGGAVANDAAGEKSVKYGSTRDWVRGLKVVLANGETIETGRLSAKELDRKKGQATFEGEVYRQLDNLLTDNLKLVQDTRPDLPVGAGYYLWGVKGPRGSFDLTPLFVGSQGTLGLVCEVTFATRLYNPEFTQAVACFDDYRSASDVVAKLTKLSPSLLELISGPALAAAKGIRPSDFEWLTDDAKVAVVVEFDDWSAFVQRSRLRRAQRAMKPAQVVRATETREDRQAVWSLRRLGYPPAGQATVILAENLVIPPDALGEFLSKLEHILTKSKQVPMWWGRAGRGGLQVAAFVDLSKPRQRALAAQLSEEVLELALKSGGSLGSAEGRHHGQHLNKLFSQELTALMKDVKKIFDPYGIFNPDIKTGAKGESLQSELRESALVANFDNLTEG